MACNEICLRHRAIKPPPPDTRYGVGQKRCNSCDIFMKWDGMRCPCCGQFLRTKPRARKTKELLRKYRTVGRI